MNINIKIYSYNIQITLYFIQIKFLRKKLIYNCSTRFTIYTVINMLNISSSDYVKGECIVQFDTIYNSFKKNEQVTVIVDGQVKQIICKRIYKVAYEIASPYKRTLWNDINNNLSGYTMKWNPEYIFLKLHFKKKI